MKKNFFISFCLLWAPLGHTADEIKGLNDYLELEENQPLAVEDYFSSMIPMPDGMQMIAQDIRIENRQYQNIAQLMELVQNPVHVPGETEFVHRQAEDVSKYKSIRLNEGKRFNMHSYQFSEKKGMVGLGLVFINDDVTVRDPQKPMPFVVNQPKYGTKKILCNIMLHLTIDKESEKRVREDIQKIYGKVPSMLPHDIQKLFLKHMPDWVFTHSKKPSVEFNFEDMMRKRDYNKVQTVFWENKECVYQSSIDDLSIFLKNCEQEMQENPKIKRDFQKTYDQMLDIYNQKLRDAQKNQPKPQEDMSFLETLALSLCIYNENPGNDAFKKVMDDISRIKSDENLKMEEFMIQFDPFVKKLKSRELCDFADKLIVEKKENILGHIFNNDFPEEKVTRNADKILDAISTKHLERYVDDNKNNEAVRKTKHYKNIDQELSLRRAANIL